VQARPKELHQRAQRDPGAALGTMPNGGVRHGSSDAAAHGSAWQARLGKSRFGVAAMVRRGEAGKRERDGTRRPVFFTVVILRSRACGTVENLTTR
jgi:hypothetical protein